MGGITLLCAVPHDRRAFNRAGATDARI